MSVHQHKCQSQPQFLAAKILVSAKPHWKLTVDNLENSLGQKGNTDFTDSSSFPLHKTANSCRALIFVVESFLDSFLRTNLKSASTLKRTKKNKLVLLISKLCQ